jgi:hypothetical protein
VLHLGHLILALFSLHRQTARSIHHVVFAQAHSLHTHGHRLCDARWLLEARAQWGFSLCSLSRLVIPLGTTRIAGFTACPVPVFTACLYIDLLIHLASIWIGVGDFACNGLFSPAYNSLSLQLSGIEMRDVYLYLIKVMSSLYLRGMAMDFVALCLTE